MTQQKKPPIRLDPDSTTTLGRQLYEQIRDQILSGSLQPGEKVLSTRELSEIIGVSRPTVAGSYELLLQDGYLETRHGSGTFVSSQLPIQRSETAPSATASLIPNRLSSIGERLHTAKAKESEFPEAEIDFYCWRPVIGERQMEEWGRLWWRSSRGVESPTLDFHGDPLGFKPLREAIARDLDEKRGIHCQADQIVMVSSLQQALDLILRLHVDRGDRVASENPGYPHIRETVRFHGAEVVPIPVDNEGIVIDKLFNTSCAGMKVLYVTPSHQCPTGVIMSLPRRLRLLEWAHQNGILIIEDEDDFETENAYEGRPTPSLLGLDKYDSVIYIGSFARLFAPFVSLTYMVVPRPLVKLYSQARELMGADLPEGAQHSLTEFINQGYLRSQVRRMRDVYDVRRNSLISALKKHFGNKVSLASCDSGLYVLATFDSEFSSTEIVQRASSKGVGLVSTEAFYNGRAKPREFIIGFGDLNEAQIEEGVRRLAKVIK